MKFIREGTIQVENMRMIDIVKDLLCPHHYTLLEYAKEIRMEEGLLKSYRIYDIYAVLKCSRCGLVKLKYIKTVYTSDLPELFEIYEKYDCWD